MELLAPAGNLENFHAAIEAGADAVYVGAPGCNARNLARDLRLEEIGAMIRYCHDREKKLYLAANSLVIENELSQVIETLSLLESLQPDALIVQDLGIIGLVKTYFPQLRLHASTLMLAHNKDCIDMFAKLGCERVVLARELTLKEIMDISSSTEMELEVFVHGAMCFSYSGLCLFSSYLGGKSSLRGRCVQPCRRKYAWQGKKSAGRERKSRGGSYLFSMNDLEGLHAIPALKEAGIVSLKIEGRLRSAQYVYNVVRAYRTILDAENNQFNHALNEAQQLVEKAMSRKLSSGYFESSHPDDAITPYHSGNIGYHLGQIEKINERDGNFFGQIKIKEDIGKGDRLRLHFESTGNRTAFTLKEILLGGKSVGDAQKGDLVLLALPKEVGLQRQGVTELYIVDKRNTKGLSHRGNLKTGNIQKQLTETKKRIARKLQFIRSNIGCDGLDIPNKIHRTQHQSHKNKAPFKRGRGGQSLKKLPLELWLKTDNIKNIQYRMPFIPDHFLLVMEKNMVRQAGQIKRLLGKGSRKVIWSLPSILFESDVKMVKKQIQMLLRTGFRSFQIGHMSQVELFGNERVHLYGDYTLNLTNNQAVHLAGLIGLTGVQLAIESDRDGLKRLLAGYKTVLAASRSEKRKKTPEGPPVRLGLTVYGTPPLFTTRLKGKHLQHDKTLMSPKGETFTISKNPGGSQIYATRPFSLLPYIHELKSMGLDYMVVDISGRAAGKRELQEISERLAGQGRFPKLPTFNYLGRLE